MEREMKIRGLMIDPAANTPIVVLKEVDGDQLLPIWVGPFEANAIAFEIEKMAPPRPMTHDLLRNLILQMDGRVRRVVVTELRNNTFFAVIELEIAGKMIFLDARPSDAIALALRVDAPIFVHESVLESSSSVIVERTEEETTEKDDEMEFDWPEEIDESDIGRG
ncbi:MAG: bifunctional nuclease family protein [Chloracidobacterium sp.]|nr:bifunctional nuclease family protein [Chloracidobacterium sp.]MDW8216918.1 bifunctional nuclease family protein [Acidobacteriota bacterium]